ncbi:MAG: ABC transporter permease [Comamonadaceae bacterium]|nr:ABC transporter permease [Comamonadaceae bacterium]
MAGDRGGRAEGAAHRLGDQLPGRPDPRLPGRRPAAAGRRADLHRRPGGDRHGARDRRADDRHHRRRPHRRGLRRAARAPCRSTRRSTPSSTLGVSPIDFLVLPRMLALMLMVPLLDALCRLRRHAGRSGRRRCSSSTSARSSTTPRRCARSTLKHFLVGLSKGVAYGAMVAFAGCLRGMQCGRSAEAVGQAATSAVVTGILLITVVASIMTIVYYQLGDLNMAAALPIEVRDLTLAYGDFVVQRDLEFRGQQGRRLRRHGRQRLRQDHADAPHDRPAAPGRRARCSTPARTSGAPRTRTSSASSAGWASCTRAARCGVR